MRRLVPALVLLACATPAAALDCSAPKADVDKALCASPEARAADEAMAAAWKTAHDSAAGADRDALLATQRLWIKRRGYGCDSEQPDYAACLVVDTQARRAWLLAQPEAGPGTGNPMQRAIVFRPGRNGAYSVDVELLKFVDPKAPGEKTFNAAVTKMIADVPKDTKDIDRDRTYSHDLTMRMTWASPRLLSARLDGYDFEGGAHGNPYTLGLNIDVAGGRKFAFADAFDAAAHQKLDEDCYRQVSKERRKRLGEDIAKDFDKEMRKTLHKDVGDLEFWNFTAKGATIIFGAYELGSYAEGSYTCEIPLQRLKDLAKPAFPLPD